MAVTAVLLPTGGRPHTRCDLCCTRMPEPELLGHLLSEHPDRFGVGDVPERVDVP